MLLHAGTELILTRLHIPRGRVQGIVSAGLSWEVTTLSVRAQHAGIGFNPLDLVRISDNATVEEFVRIKSICLETDTMPLLRCSPDLS
jgi:hypothetical protein